MKRMLFSIVALCACKTDSNTAADKAVEKPIHYVGVEPDKFDCGSISSVAALGAVLGGTVAQVEAPPSPERGIARRCVYDVTIPNGAIAPPEPGKKPDPDAAPKRIDALEHWSFDFDCREDYQKTAQREMAEYRQKSADAVAYYNDVQKDAAVAASFKEKDAGAETHAAPVAAFDVQVGKVAVDVMGQGVMFVDDDAPCFVRVFGPEASRRLELAKLVSKNLTFTNAPMKPRAVQ